MDEKIENIFIAQMCDKKRKWKRMTPQEKQLEKQLYKEEIEYMREVQKKFAHQVRNIPFQNSSDR